MPEFQLLNTKKHNITCIMDIPATLRLLLVIGKPAAVAPLHRTTVPFSMAAAVNVRVEVMSARVVANTTVGLAIFVRVATKSKSSHRTDRCNTVAIQSGSSGCSTCELNASTGW